MINVSKVNAWQRHRILGTLTELTRRHGLGRTRRVRESSFSGAAFAEKDRSSQSRRVLCRLAKCSKDSRWKRIRSRPEQRLTEYRRLGIRRVKASDTRGKESEKSRSAAEKQASGARIDRAFHPLCASQTKAEKPGVERLLGSGISWSGFPLFFAFLLLPRLFSRLQLPPLIRPDNNADPSALHASDR